jgi:hypothetical protein
MTLIRVQSLKTRALYPICQKKFFYQPLDFCLKQDISSIKMQTCTVKSTFAPVRAARTTRATRVVAMANMESVKKAAAGFGVGLCSLALTGSAFAGANVKLGADSGT